MMTLLMPLWVAVSKAGNAQLVTQNLEESHPWLFLYTASVMFDYYCRNSELNCPISVEEGGRTRERGYWVLVGTCLGGSWGL